ncbi:ferritin family protein [Clostridiaceae bacterium 35-E11]
MAIENLNELEVLQIAKKIEETGYKFYKEAAAQFEDEEIKNIFEYLALEEQEHIETFQRIYERVLEKTQEQKPLIYEASVAAYLKALSETAVFNVRELTKQRVGYVYTAKEALIMGLQAEKDSILFYEEILKHTEVEILQKTLKRLIREEIKHLHKFRNLINALEG